MISARFCTYEPSLKVKVVQPEWLTPISVTFPAFSSSSASTSVTPCEGGLSQAVRTIEDKMLSAAARIAWSTSPLPFLTAPRTNDVVEACETVPDSVENSAIVTPYVLFYFHGHQPRRLGGAANNAVACCFHASRSARRSSSASRSRSSAARSAAFSASSVAVLAGSAGGSGLPHSEPEGVPNRNTRASSAPSIE